MRSEEVKQATSHQAGEAGCARARAAPRGRTREQLYNDARKLGIEGRSKMNKGQLQRAVDARK